MNFFQEYSDEPYVGSHMNTVTSSSHGSAKHAHSKSWNNYTVTSSLNDTKSLNTQPANNNATLSGDRVHDSSFLGGMDPTKVKLDDLIDTDTYELKVDVTDMIDFATIGNPKTGTSFMSQWFRKHPELLTPKSEMRAMQWPQTGPGRVVEIMLPLLKEKTPQKKLGYKCPADIRAIGSLRNLRDYFPKAKLIVGKLVYAPWQEGSRHQW